MKTTLALALAVALASSASAADFGEITEALARAQAERLFGIRGTLRASSTLSLTAAEAQASPARLVTVAPGLRVSVVSAHANLGPNIDQMLLWPNDRRPTHIIACNEQGSGQIAVQRVSLATGFRKTSSARGCRPATPRV